MFELSGTHCHAIWHHDGTQGRPTARQYVPVWTLCRMLMKAAGLTAGCQIVRLSRAFIAINDSRMRRRRRGELSWWGRLLRLGRGGRGRGGFTATTEEMVVASVAPGGPTSLSRSGSERPTERRTAESRRAAGGAAACGAAARLGDGHRVDPPYPELFASDLHPAGIPQHRHAPVGRGEDGRWRVSSSTRSSRCWSESHTYAGPLERLADRHPGGAVAAPIDQCG